MNSRKKSSPDLAGMLSLRNVGRAFMLRATLGLALGAGLLPVAGRGEAAEPSTRDRSPAQLIQSGRAAFERGALEEAVRDWRTAADRADREPNLRAEVEALVNLAGAYYWLGQPRLSVETSERAIAVAERTRDRRSLLLAKSSLGIACTCSRQTEWAEQNLLQALALAGEEKETTAAVAIRSNLGNLLAERGQFAKALETFRQAATLAEQTGLGLARARALGNAAAVAARAGQPDDAATLNTAALGVLLNLPPSHEQAFLWIRAGQTDRELQQPDRARQSYRRALAVAEKLGDRRAMTYALGYLGQLEESRREFTKARELTRQAILLAQQVPLPEALYQWERQMGRLWRAQGDRSAAIAAYRRAVQTVEPLRADLALGCGSAQGSFRETVGPVYWELADLLLQETDAQRDPDQRARTLREVRDTVEQLKSAELEDYLKDECAGGQQVQAAAIERIGKRTAVIYVIPLPDRTELLVSIGGNLQRFKSPVTAAQLESEVRQFRSNLENRATSRYLKQAQQLDRWLIDPLREALAAQQVETLVFVPDGSLRTIPMAALHDGHQFLIERYAVAITPGLTLLGPRPVPREGLKVLAAGLSLPVAQHAPLPYAAEEVAAVQRLFQADSLLDQRFAVAELRKDLAENQYAIVHLATHGEISQDASQSYLLTFDGRLTLNELADLLRPGKFRGQPVELLTLSACQTAAGDDRAALGLGGVAVKAGARSALATLWFVHDQSTALLMGGFYEEWRRDPRVSKAQALQRAQLKLLRDPRYDHPGFWSPYLIIGNWL